ncbi:hypothetical protein PAXRUDRAFT_173361, partial [Paxillus rubicundulus Ve08.2h10]
ISVVHSAVAMFYAPSDPSGVNGMQCKIIRSTPSWRHGPAHRDCVFVNLASTTAGMHGMSIARVLLFLTFDHD